MRLADSQSLFGLLSPCGRDEFCTQLEHYFCSWTWLRGRTGTVLLHFPGVFRPRKIVNGTWPDYERTRAGARPNQDGTGPDRCMAGFFWCILAAQRGWTIEETAHKLVEVSAMAQEGVRLKDQGYALVTAENGAAAAERGKQRGTG